MNNTLELEITGMTCGGCSAHIERDMNNTEGVESSSVDYKTGFGEFTIDENKLNKSELISKINDIGKYKVKNGNADFTESTNDITTYKKSDSNSYNYDLIIIGGGSAAFSAMTTANDLGKSVLLVNGGLDIGGTCVNVGCVPSKHLIRAGESVHKASFSPFKGISPNAPDIDFAQIIKDKKSLVAEMREKKYIKVAESVDNARIIEGWAEFINDRTIKVDNEKFSASKILIATGSTTNIPNIKGLDEVGYLTNATLFDLEDKPESLTILGAGYIGLEMAQAYSRLGIKVRVMEYSDRVLRKESKEISDELQKQFSLEGIDLYPNVRIQSIEKVNDQIFIHATDSDNSKVDFIENGHIVVATGTNPNTTKMKIENANIELTNTNHIHVNDKQETNVEHIYSAGDCTNSPAFVYTAALEGKNAILNAFGIEDKHSDYTSLPWVVFTDPQVAGVGLDEDQAKSMGISTETTTLAMSEVPRALAALDTRGFIKLIRNSITDKIIGARIVAPEGGELIMEAVLAIKYGITATQLAETIHPYLTMGEGMKIAAITFKKDISELSCCAT
jgi:mercuric reductase